MIGMMITDFKHARVEEDSEDTYRAFCGVCNLQAKIWCELELRETHSVRVQRLQKRKTKKNDVANAMLILSFS